MPIDVPSLKANSFAVAIDSYAMFVER
jgi:hypothetical protein